MKYIKMSIHAKKLLKIHAYIIMKNELEGDQKVKYSKGIRGIRQ